MKHHEGELGISDYDETQFRVDGELLRYIGEETDGSKIKIPDGVVDLAATFRGSDLVTPPKIPKSVKYCNCTFEESSLVTPPVIPEGVVNCENAFRYCRYLTKAAELPEGVLNTENMYLGCLNLKDAGSIPSTVTNCRGMFYWCIQLKEAAVFEPGAECCRKVMYCHCVNLEKAYDVECSEQTEGMYNSCFSLRLSDEQVAKLSPIKLSLALARTFTNCTGLLQHYFVPILLKTIWYVIDLCADNLGMTKQEAFEKWVMPFVEYGILTGYSVAEFKDMCMGVMEIPDEFIGPYVENVCHQQFVSYRKPNASSRSSSKLKTITAFM